MTAQLYILCIFLISSITTLEEKVGQLLMVHFNGEEANSEAKKVIEELHVGGCIYYNWSIWK
jgi:hypothetical protein